jgi:hypothetical protein
VRSGFCVRLVPTLEQEPGTAIKVDEVEDTFILPFASRIMQMTIFYTIHANQEYHFDRAQTCAPAGKPL